MEDLLCEKCKNALFSQANRSLCDTCAEKLFEKVKDFIEENPNSSIQEVAEATGVKKKHLNKWIREGRLELKTAEAQKEREKALNFQKQLTDFQESKEEVEEKQEEGRKGHFYTRKD